MHEDLHFKVDGSLEMLKDLHDSITDFRANTVSRDHGDRLGLGIARRRHVCNFCPGLHVKWQVVSIRARSVSCPYQVLRGAFADGFLVL